MGSLLVEIVTPEAALWKGSASAVMARSSEGEFTVMPQHTPTVGDLVAGIVRVTAPEGVLSFEIESGYFQVGPSGEEGVTRATILAGVAKQLQVHLTNCAHANGVGTIRLTPGFGGGIRAIVRTRSQGDRAFHLRVRRDAI